jgi:N-acetylmuramoyl-L-alanine amidase
MNNLYRTSRTAKVILMVFLTTISILGTSTPLNLLDSSIKVIAIDAGHGGKDPGCLGTKGVNEKDVALKIALKLGKLIEDSLPGVKVVYTRSTDKFVPLWQRASIANKHMADLFISVHCNAHTTSALSGAETYVMGLHKSSGNLNVSKRENDALKLEGDYEKTGHYKDYDPGSPEAHIMLSLYQNAYLKHSIKLASKVQSKVRKQGKILDLGVKQAGFVVLWKTTMPSILIETGYLTNPANEAYLISEKGKNESASNIFEAVKEFKTEFEKNKK